MLCCTALAVKPPTTGGRIVCLDRGNFAYLGPDRFLEHGLRQVRVDAPEEHHLGIGTLAMAMGLVPLGMGPGLAARSLLRHAWMVIGRIGGGGWPGARG